MRKFLLLPILVVLLAGCASTSVTAIRNPAIADISYSRILIVVPFNDLALRGYAETQFVKDFLDAGVTALRSMDVVPPIQKYTDAEWNKIIEQHHIDGVMVVSLTNVGSSQSYVPQSSRTTSSASIYGNTVYGRSQTTTSGGYYISEPNMNFEISLFDAATGSIAWKATTYTDGNAYANTNTLLGSLAAEVVKKYEKDARR